VGAPVLLSAGTTYSLSFYIASPAPLDAANSLFLTYWTISFNALVSSPDLGRILPGGAFAFPTTTVAGGAYYRGMVNAQVAPVPVPVPEPTTLLLLGTGLGAVVARRRLKKRA